MVETQRAVSLPKPIKNLFKSYDHEDISETDNGHNHPPSIFYAYE